jgi:colanic acid/amylovoran biosynthesis glycosyltransferase
MFPFGEGETYLKEELKVLSRHFKKIIIYPNDYYNKNDIFSHSLSENVEVLNLNRHLKAYRERNLSDYYFLFVVTLKELFSTDDKGSFFSNFRFNLVNLWTQIRLSRLFSAYLEANSYHKGNALFYSYWFHKSAMLLSVLKERGTIEGFVSRAHSIDLYHNDWNFIRFNIKVPPYKMFKLKNVSALFTVSEHGANYLRKKFSRYSGKFSASYLGVRIQEEPVNETIKEYFHIVTCSGIDHNKRVHELAKALMHIASPVKWTHFGGGEARLLEDVNGIIAAYPSHIQATIMGKRNNDEVLQFYRENKPDLFVNLSIVEGLPVSIMEAMSNRMPVLATAVYGTPEAVKEGITGFLLPVSFTMEEVIERLNYCISNKALLGRMGNSAFRLCSESFSSEKNYTQFANQINII